jgi:gamma-glutamylcyclotransferase (GGCT)/AIG2-like uncharacterized protein YtfP
MPLLFSYGTLQQSDVQLATFGRLLQGEKDDLVAHEPSWVRIKDSELLALRGETHHANVIFNGRDDSRVSGTVYEITDAEIAAADRYEADAEYKRTLVVLASGKEAWVYSAPANEATKGPVDPYDLNRFVQAQENVYAQALA